MRKPTPLPKQKNKTYLIVRPNGAVHQRGEGPAQTVVGIWSRALTHKPQPVRRVMIPKPGCGERPLGIPCLVA
ncbi:MAG: hypothetical protein DMG72_12555 [Acidobacteria bacterium]|nr:MAG: hypothetical protein DMG72_12555 [Acidobacteriota bacterium]